MDRGAPVPNYAQPAYATDVSYAPPTMATPAVVAAPVPDPQVNAQPKSLSAALADAFLSQYEEALRELGCAFVSDLVDLEEQDMVEIGLKKIEIKRLMRIAVTAQ